MGLVGDLDLLGLASAGPLPPEVQADAQHDNDCDRYDRGGLMDQRGEYERDQNHGGRHDRRYQDQDVGAGLTPDTDMSHGDQREDNQGDGTADRGDRVQFEQQGHD